MSEPPGGRNHGRKSVSGGAQIDLDVGFYQALEDGLTIYGGDESTKRRSRKPENTIRHGTIAAYNNDRCRCEDCREAMRVYRKRKRVQS